MTFAIVVGYPCYDDDWCWLMIASNPDSLLIDTSPMYLESKN